MTDAEEYRFSALGAVYFKEDPENLRSAFESLAAQSRLADQVVIVVDGPVPREINAVIDDYACLLPLSILRLNENVGLARALNAGLEICRYNWIARYDTDDINLPHRFHEQIKLLTENPDIVLVGSAIAEFDGDLTRRISEKRVPCRYEDVVRYSRYRNPFNHMTVFFRKDIVLSFGGYPKFDLYEDFALWGSMLNAGHQCLNSNMVLVHARAGHEMVRRRGGWRYLKAEYDVFNMFCRIGHINFFLLMYNISVRLIVRLSSNKIRSLFYYSFLRKI